MGFIELNLANFFEIAPFLVSFIAGILTFLSPCILPLIPAYLSYISEISLQELKNGGKLGLFGRLRILRRAIFFVLGLGIVFVLLGAVAARLLNGGILLSPYVAYIAGGILILFGLHTLGIFTIPFLNYHKSFDISSQKFTFGRDFFVPFLLGASFSLGWTPCVGPILAGVIALASLEAQRGVILLIVYTLGLSLPFLFCAILISYAFRGLDFLKRYFRWVEWISGGLLIGIGILIASGKMSEISNFLVQVLR
ncbi:MAG: sulfite exporter TauE/SafE family protein [Helicobacter sp.]|nr:sulfite exporter TauE/SafE family protein [Helicobacter sp.]